MGSNPFSIHFFESLHLEKTPEMIRKKLAAAAQSFGRKKFRDKAAGAIIAGTKPEQAIPDVYHPYRALVRDGIHFFLSHISLDRLLDVLVCQVEMDREAAAEQRLLELAKHFPTLHKLGQIIARNQNVDPGVRQWLIHLENGRYGTAAEDLLSHIAARLDVADACHRVNIEPHILSEASVGAVIAFEWSPDKEHAAIRGVFKVLKPHIKKNLAEELTVFERMAAFFENHRQRYDLKEFRFLEVFEDVVKILEKEVDLTAEQAHLREATRFYADADPIVIPNVMPLSDETMTAMAYIDGRKITDGNLTHAQRSDCAKTLAASLICRPIFAPDQTTLFHGDPHAGNILWCGDRGTDGAKIALLDWSQAGHLTRAIRLKVVQFIKSVITEDRRLMSACIRSLAKNTSVTSALSRMGLWRSISSRVETKKYKHFSLIKKAFWLLEQLSYDGIVFPKDLMLFRKAMFTLEGVICDLDPDFSMDAFFYNYMGRLLVNEVPSRLGRSFFLQKDEPEHYQSLLSNGDLQSMIFNQYAATVQYHTRTAVSLLEKQSRIMGLIFN
jgi:ubiquinone biosynthesis protein